MKTMSRAGQFALLLTLVATLALAQDPGSGTVTGTLVIDGAVREGARIVASSSASSAWEVEAVTDENGGFSVSDAPLGTIWLKAYDADDQLLAMGEGELSEDGQVLDLDLDG